MAEMNDLALQALRIETDFLAGVEANFRGGLSDGAIRGGRLVHSDQAAALRDALADRGSPAPADARPFPCNRRIEVHPRRRWWPGSAPAEVTIATVLSPIGRLVDSADGVIPPTDLGMLVDHVQAVAPEPEWSYVVGVCSPGGFTPEVLRSQLEFAHVKLVLIEPRQDGAWRVTALNEGIPADVLALFDPTTTTLRLEQLRREIDRRRADLSGSGLHAGELAARFDLLRDVVAAAFRQAALADPELHVSEQEGESLLYRGAATSPSSVSAGIFERVRALFDAAAGEAEKIRVLAERRAALSAQRDRIYDDIVRLEQEDARMMAEGRRATSPARRRQLAGRIAQLRRDAARQAGLADLIGAQINILAADIHNLTLLQQGRLVEIPSTETLTRNASRAEEMLENIQATADLAAATEAPADDHVAETELTGILEEFDGAQKTPANADAPGRQSERAERPEAPGEASEAPSRRLTEPEA